MAIEDTISTIHLYLADYSKAESLHDRYEHLLTTRDYLDHALHEMESLLKQSDKN